MLRELSCDELMFVTGGADEGDSPPPSEPDFPQPDNIDEGDPDGDNDGDGIPNWQDDLVVHAIQPDVTDLGDGLWGYLYPDGIAKVYEYQYTMMGIKYGTFKGMFEYSIAPQNGGWSYSFPFGISYEPSDTQYILTPVVEEPLGTGTTPP